MSELVGIICRWVARNFLSFLLIIAVILAAKSLLKEIKPYLAARDTVLSLTSTKELLERDVNTKKKAVAERLSSFKKAGKAALKKRIGEIDQEIKQKSSTLGSPPSLKKCVVIGSNACDQYFEGTRATAEIWLLESERNSLDDLLQGIDMEVGAKELERLRKVHVATYAQYENSQVAIQTLKDLTPLWRVPFTEAYEQFKQLDQQHDNLYTQNLRASEAYVRQKRTLDLIAKAQSKGTIWADRAKAHFDALDKEIRSRKATYQQGWIAILFDSVNEVVPAAMVILLGIILTPIGIKGFFYFIVAPIASRRTAITLLPEVSGVIADVREDLRGDSDRLKVSEVSHAVTINQDQELLIHPEYLQSSAAQGEKDTKWLLDWSYPLSSIAAGLFGLTRIRTASIDTIVVSATKDPLGEVGIISLPEGAALVLQPHRLVGVLQPRNCPVRISRHWRLGSLHAWLTLQLRFLAFHGPVKLVVMGCRGVRVEAAGKGRSINQAATIGFSANLAYSTTRCETFGAYLMGKQELFNDNFGGGPGFYVYEEMPHGGQKTGLFGRGIEGFTDSLLKVLGV